eukprot:TRINITY_DN42238_c0_g1_i1.p1 TRINITY_DN42238_c0_g1~~TRINITY_DN42238_c0_g1_i1.p1  ORF type:complete len:558 (+),score=108.35 TRINITY_DN42238_c0_g1_i1:63-1676(+)
MAIDEEVLDACLDGKRQSVYFVGDGSVSERYCSEAGRSVRSVRVHDEANSIGCTEEFILVGTSCGDVCKVDPNLFAVTESFPQAHSGRVTSIASTTTHCYSADSKGTVLLWAPDTPPETIHTHPSPVHSLTVHANGMWSTGSDDGAILWDGRKVYCRLPTPFSVYSTLLVQNEANTMWCGCLDGIIRVYNLPQGLLLKEITAHGTHPVDNIALAGSNIWSSSSDGSVAVWDIASKKLLERKSTEDSSSVQLILPTQLLTTHVLWTATNRGSLNVWHSETMLPVKQPSRTGTRREESKHVVTLEEQLNTSQMLNHRLSTENQRQREIIAGLEKQLQSLKAKQQEETESVGDQVALMKETQERHIAMIEKYQTQVEELKKRLRLTAESRSDGTYVPNEEEAFIVATREQLVSKLKGYGVYLEQSVDALKEMEAALAKMFSRYDDSIGEYMAMGVLKSLEEKVAACKAEWTRLLTDFVTESELIKPQYAAFVAHVPQRRYSAPSARRARTPTPSYRDSSPVTSSTRRIPVYSSPSRRPFR